MSAETFNLLITTANTLTWPGAFAIAACAVSAAAVAAVFIWGIFK